MVSSHPEATDNQTTTKDAPGELGQPAHMYESSRLRHQARRPRAISILSYQSAHALSG